MRPVILGQVPEANEMLAAMAGVDGDRFLASTDRINKLSSGLEGVLNLFSILRGRRVLVLGEGSQMRWEVDGSPGSVVASMPHPSEKSRWWNDKRNAAKARGFLKDFLLPCVHVEGVDGSGKSTLVSQLHDLTSMRVVDTDDPPKDWKECLARIHRRLDPGTICDRSSGLISELVYGPVIRGMMVEKETTILNVLRSLVGAVIFVYCRPPRKSLKPTARPGELSTPEGKDHSERVMDNLGDLYDRYDHVMSRVVREGGAVIEYDRTRPGSMEYLMRCLCAV